MLVLGLGNFGAGFADAGDKGAGGFVVGVLGDKLVLRNLLKHDIGIALDQSECFSCSGFLQFVERLKTLTFRRVCSVVIRNFC